MADVTLTYKGNTIAEMSDTGTKTLKTAGKYCEGDIGVNYVKPSSGGTSDELAKKLITGEGIITELPSDITSIRDYAFHTCPLATFTVLPNGITDIGKYAFYDNTPNITSLPSSLENIGEYAFYQVVRGSVGDSLWTISLPDGLLTIGNFAFANNKYLKLTSIPGSVISIGAYAFQNCTGLTTITFKGTPSSIASNALTGCNNLTTINVPWAEGAVAGAPWGATNATIHYNYTT